jgi:hypothetical protein
MVKAVADSFELKVSSVVRESLYYYLGSEQEGLEQLAKEAEIERLVRQLDFLDRTQRKMLRSGSFLAKNLPRDWPPAKRWAVAVGGEEREALELLLGEREHLAREIARLVKETYCRSGKVVLLDRSPWYKLLSDSECSD